MVIKNEDEYIDQYGKAVYIAAHRREPDPEEGGHHPGEPDKIPANETYDMAKMMLESTEQPIEPYLDKAAQDVAQPFIITGGSFGNDGLWVKSTGDTSISMNEPEKLGKWEYWNIETAGGLRRFFKEGKYKMPLDYGKDELLVIGAGRGLLAYYLGKTGLENNNGIFNNVTTVEEDSELVDYQKSTISDRGVNNVLPLVGRSLEVPSPRTADYETMLSKKYDVIVATLPFSNQRSGIYHINQQIRTAKAEIDNGNRYAEDGKDWPFTKQRDFYDGISKFEDKCYDENFNRHNVLFNNARKFLKPGGYLVSVHNALASDIDTFKPMIENGGLELVHHTMIDKGMGGHAHARHFFLRQVLVHSNIGNQYVMVTKIKN